MLRYCPLTVFLLVWMGHCAPRLAHATCGDWLQHSDPVQDAARANVFPVDDATAEHATGSDNNANSPAPARPCNGPLCRQAPSGLGPVPASPISERQHHDVAWMNQERSVVHTFDAEWSITDASFVPVGHKMGIERPPQAF